MSHVIIGVHGLANKPKPALLESGWKSAICEGIENLGNRVEPTNINFHLADWADLYYSKRLTGEKGLYKKAESKSLKAYDENVLDSMRGWFGDTFEKPVEWLKNRGLLTDAAGSILENYLQDLDKYYDNKDLRAKTRAVVLKAIQAHKSKRIFLIGHSMGSIITYDVLRELGRSNKSNTIEHYVTIGSPLGLPHVQSHIVREFGNVRTPSVVKKWSNFADRRDPVSLDSHIARDFKKNSQGIRPVDDLVLNDWGGINHKSYGYLRCPEVSEVVREFL